MTDPPRCSRCGAPVADAGEGDLCPACLLKLALDMPLDVPSDAPGLLARQEATRSSSAAGPFADGTHASLPSAQTATMIGAYRILRKLGEGGMGVVYEAEQQQPRRLVALKVIRGGTFVDEQQVKLFDRETRALARLKHPGIAAIYESGCTPHGEHFFAMELVRGETLAEYGARRRELEVKELLAIFLNICDAISYAHQHGVIHRDLKPGNIMVTREAGSSSVASTAAVVPAIKVLDFGLARITEVDGATSLLSEVGRIAGTLPYMSPEQVRGDPDAIDLRSDIYALGVILYEMLTGSRPYEIHQAHIVEAARVICEEAPKPPSQAWAEARNTPASKLSAKRFDRDLETIILKALEKEPDRRYQSVAALADEVGRFLTQQPILARPPSAAYQFRKLVARHKTPFALLAALLALLVAFSVAMALQSARIARERDRARTEAETSKRVTEFMVELFTVADPSEARGNTITAREVLDRGAERVGKELKDQAAVQSTLQDTLGRVYGQLGLYDKSSALLESALKTRRRVFGNESPETAASLYSLSDTLSIQGDHATAERLARELVAVRRKVSGSESLELAASLHLLGGSLTPLGKGAEAEPIEREALAIRRKVLGGEHALVAETLWGLGVLLSSHRWEMASGEPLLVEALAMKRRLLGNDHPDTLISMMTLGEHFWRKGDYQTAEPLYREALATQRRVLGADHPRIARDQNRLALLLAATDRLEEAEELGRQTLALARRTPGISPGLTRVFGLNLALFERARDNDTAAEARYRDMLKTERTPDVLYSLGTLLAARGAPEAETLLREAAVSLKTSSAALLLSVKNRLADTLQRRGQRDEAEQLYEEVRAQQQLRLEDLRKRTPGNLMAIANAELVLGECLKGLRQHDKAEPLLVRSFAALKKRNERDYRTREALEAIIELYGAWGKPEKAAEYRALVRTPSRSRN